MKIYQNFYKVKYKPLNLTISTLSLNLRMKLNNIFHLGFFRLIVINDKQVRISELQTGEY